uniref:Uncharacterized protein n=1 Tax=Nelumbo nucifera TaxID=4432 RepID=A0A822ZE61_NELNU|nr:TPA_asm: hypothetical protein HUJ06_016062 [Nelumbo nucifera]
MTTIKHKTKHAISWSKLCLSKKMRGLGIKHNLQMNKAMFSKQVRRLLTCPNTTWANAIKAKYIFPRTSIFEAKRCRSSSHWWKCAHDILKGKI